MLPLHQSAPVRRTREPRTWGPASAGPLVLLLALVATACHGGPGSAGALTSTATDEWIRSFPLSAGGVLDLSNRNGPIEVEGVDGPTVEVRAERIAKAPTEESARALLPRIAIEEETGPDKVVVRTRGIEGILLGAGWEVRYYVRVPRGTVVHVRTTNGNLVVRGVHGRVTMIGTNGTLTGEALSGGVEARATNGAVSIALAAVGDDFVDVRTTNGSVTLTLPASTQATLTATATNGRIDLTGVQFEAIGEPTRRRVRGRMNGGGTPVDVATTNGNVRVAAQP